MALIECPGCGKKISDKAAQCPNCGRKVEILKDNKEEGFSPRCKECGEVLPEEAIVCPSCGCPVEKEERESVNESPTSKETVSAPKYVTPNTDSRKAENETKKPKMGMKAWIACFVVAVIVLWVINPLIVGVVAFLAAPISLVGLVVQWIRKKPKKKWGIALAVSVALFLLYNIFGVPKCDHTWAKATCTVPETCTKCGKTRGETLPHHWKDATCEAPKTCYDCGATEGDVAEHTWEEATCTTPKTCKVCKLTEGEALGHKWTEATCTEPKTCTVCNATEGEALGHTLEEATILRDSTCAELGLESGVCTVCGETVEQEIPKKEHTPGDWTITEYPTEYSKGTRVRNCTVCGEEIEKEKFEMSPEELEQTYKSQCETISYKELERTPDNYEGRNVKFSGYVVQVCSESSSPWTYSAYRVATSGKYDNVVMVLVDNYGSNSRILEDDYITFYGEFDGLYSYTAVRGNSITIPKVIAKYVNY